MKIANDNFHCVNDRVNLARLAISLLVGLALFSVFILWLANKSAEAARNNREALHTPIEYFYTDED